MFQHYLRRILSNSLFYQCEPPLGSDPLLQIFSYSGVPLACKNKLFFLQDQRRPVEKSVAEMDKRCEPIGKPNEKQNETHHQKQNITLKVGTTVTDKQPPEQVKLVVVPKKQSHLSLNLTDQAFETMGSDIGDSLDTAHQKIYTGKEAIKLLKQLQHPSNKSKSTNS